MDSALGQNFLLSGEQAHFPQDLAMRQSDSQAAVHFVEVIRRDEMIWCQE